MLGNPAMHMHPTADHMIGLISDSNFLRIYSVPIERSLLDRNLINSLILYLDNPSLSTATLSYFLIAHPFFECK